MKQLDRRWKVLLVTSVAVFMAFLDVTIVNVAFPSIRVAFPEASLASLSWVLNAYNIVFAALLVPAGRLADLLGRRRGSLCGRAARAPAGVLLGARGVRGGFVPVRARAVGVVPGLRARAAGRGRGAARA